MVEPVYSKDNTDSRLHFRNQCSLHKTLAHLEYRKRGTRDGPAGLGELVFLFILGNARYPSSNPRTHPDASGVLSLPLISIQNHTELHKRLVPTVLCQLCPSHAVEQQQNLDPVRSQRRTLRKIRNIMQDHEQTTTARTLRTYARSRTTSASPWLAAQWRASITQAPECSRALNNFQ